MAFFFLHSVRGYFSAGSILEEDSGPLQKRRIFCKVRASSWQVKKVHILKYIQVHTYITPGSEGLGSFRSIEVLVGERREKKRKIRPSRPPRLLPEGRMGCAAV